MFSSLLSSAAEGYLVAGLMDGRVVAWEAKRAGDAPTQILALDAHGGAVTSLSFPKQVEFHVLREKTPPLCPPPHPPPLPARSQSTSFRIFHVPHCSFFSVLFRRFKLPCFFFFSCFSRSANPMENPHTLFF